MLNAKTVAAEDRNAPDLVRRVINETRSLSIIENLHVFLGELKRHPNAKGLADEILNEWLSHYYGEELPADTKSRKQLDQLMLDWYPRYSVGTIKEPFTRQKLLTEIFKRYFVRHMGSLYEAREDHRNDSRRLNRAK
jgi:hypothetical protein